MASYTKRATTGDQSLRLQVTLPHRDNDPFARAYTDQATRATSITTGRTATLGSKTSPTGFLDLSRELRDNIYELAVVEGGEDRSQIIEGASTHGIESNAMVNDVCSLGRVSKQVRREALETYFRYNRFIIGSIKAYKNGNWLGWPSNKKMAYLLKRLTHFEISFQGLPGVYVEQQNDGTWEGEWDETDWSFLRSENDEVSDDIIEDVCQATEKRLDMLLVALKEDRERIPEAIKQFKNDVLLVYTEAKQRARDE
ncbi:hypothetical protein HII31_00481 [Pseudocercospora fuligena]|uniref:Uncharacterized protein n=1 Tax=Pseudocercospora fuligena TaxID=685502 RepID=A0A8H6VTE5_9PEZI|nr:hypothetical protein HII31_00481 [Pseudocercospora fuligena]